ncbi:MAG: AIM24 family protein [Sneathiellaceae bacterium]
MVDAIDFRIIGSALPMVEIELDQGEGVRVEAGALICMEDGIEMGTGTGGGIFAGFRRAVSGAGFFITTLVSGRPGKTHIAFAKQQIGQTLPLDLTRHGGQLLVQRDGFLCAASGIEIDIAFTRRFGAGLFGGEGLFLAHLTGPGRWAQ